LFFKKIKIKKKYTNADGREEVNFEIKLSFANKDFKDWIVEMQFGSTVKRLKLMSSSWRVGREEKEDGRSLNLFPLKNNFFSLKKKEE